MKMFVHLILFLFSGAEAQGKWKKVKDQYRKSKKQKRSGQAARGDGGYKWATQLEFLGPFLADAV